jgi:hypothetical protein
MINIKAAISLANGNDTIDRYPPACRGIEKILCVSERIFKGIQQDWQGFLKQFKPKRSPKAKWITKLKIKPSPKDIFLLNHFELINDPDSISRSYTHRVGRLNDWYHTYGQGMYED